MSPDEVIIPVSTPGASEAADLIKKTADSFVGLGEGADKAAAGVDASTASLKENTKTAKMNQAAIDALNGAESESTKARDGSTTAVDGETAALADNTNVARENAAAKDAATIATERFSARMVDSQVAIAMANANYSKTYTALTRMESIGTPAIMKAATWSALGIGGIAYESVKQYMNLNKSLMQTITQAGVSPNRMGFLTQMDLNVAKQTGQSIAGVADMIYRVASGTASWNNGLGATNKQLQNVVSNVARLNVLGGVPAGAASEQSARVVAALLNANLPGVGNDANKAGALINATVGAGDIRQGELISSVGRGLLAAAQANGATAKDAMAWIDLLTTLGATGSIAGTRVTTGLTLLSANTKQGSMALGMVGIKPGEVQKIIAHQGIAAAATFLNNQIAQFNPIENYPKVGKGQGRQGAINELQSWGVNNISSQLISDWSSGVLRDPKTKQQQDELRQIRTLILTKAFGGAKQYVTVATLLNNVGRYVGINNAIGRNDTQAVYQAAVARAENTPSVVFHKALIGIQADLVQVGKELTPVAVEAARGLLLLTNTLTHFKAILVPIGLSLAYILGAAGLSKAASIGKGAQRMFGAGNALGSKAYSGLGRVFGGEKNAMGRFFGHLGSSLDNPSSVYNIGRGTAEKKLADDLAMSGVKINQGGDKILTAARIMAGESSSGGGFGGGRRSPSSLEKQLVKDAENAGNLSEDEKRVLQYHMSEGKLLSKTGIRNALGLGRGVANGDTAKVEEIFGKISGMQNAGRDLTTVAKIGMTGGAEDLAGAIGGSAVAGAAESAGSGIMATLGGMGAGDLLAGALGMAGGPVGMILMSTLAATVGPAILKGLGGLGSLFAPHAVKPAYIPHHGLTSLTAVKSKIQQLQAQLSALYSKNGGAPTAADFAKINNIQSQLGALGQRREELATDPSRVFNPIYAMLKNKNYAKSYKDLEAYSREGYLTTMGFAGPIANRSRLESLYKEFAASNAPATDKAQLRKALMASNLWMPGEVIKGAMDPETAVATFKSIIGQNGYQWVKDQMNSPAGQAYMMSMHRDEVVAGWAKQDLKNQIHDFGQKSLVGNLSSFTRDRAMARYNTLSQDILHMKELQKYDLAQAAIYGVNSGGGKVYASDAAQLAKRIDLFEKGIKTLTKNGMLSKSDIQDLAQNIARYNKKAWQELGMTQGDFQAAMVAAMNSSSGGLAAAVTRGYKNLSARGNVPVG